MSTGKSELLAYLAAAFATLFGLFALYIGYDAYLDRSYHSELEQGGPSEQLVAALAEQQAKLEGGRMPIEQAMQALAQKGRDGFAVLKPMPSTDLAPLAGWVRHPDYAPVVAHPIRTPRAPIADTASPEAPTAPEAPVAPTAEPAQPAAPAPN